GRIRLKSSFGTAVKFWGKSLWGNVSTYGKLLAMVALTMGDPILMERLGVPPGNPLVPHTASEWLDELLHAQGDHEHAAVRQANRPDEGEPVR
ncbi:MAG: hypothetical protein KY475_06040, partial [Planctomycetes bacterium]|nr:hypothetical protein [Planctomycetota bacterium]